MIKIIKKCFLINSVLVIPLWIAAVDTSGTVVATINTGVTPAGLALTPDNRFAYVANNNNYGITDGDSVSVLDLRNNTVVTIIHHASFNQPYTVTMNPSGTRAYVTNSNSTTITIIDTATNAVTGVITGFDGPSGMVIHPFKNIAYVNNYGGPDGVGSGNGTTVRLVDLNTNTIAGAPIVVDRAPAALAMTPDGEFVYVANYVDGNPGTGTVQAIQTRTNTVVATITGFSGPFAIAITPDGNFAYVTNFGSNNFIPIGTTVSVVNIRTNRKVATIPLGIQPSGIAINPNGRYAYATNYNSLYADNEDFTDLTPGQGTMNIIDIATNIVLPPTVAVGQSPSAVAVSSDGKFAYVSNFTSNTVTVVDILERMWLI